MNVRPLPLAIAVSVVVVGAACGLFAVTVDAAAAASIVGGTSPWFVVGALIVALRPRNPVGWLFSAVGLLWASGLSLSAYAEQTSRSTDALLTFASWYSEWFWLAALVLTVASMFVFPTGTVASPSWRPVLAVVLLCGAAAIIFASLEETVQVSKDGPVLRNPIGIDGWPDLERAGIVSPLFVLFMVASALAGVVSIVVRYRRSNGAERQQIKWVAIGVPLAVIGYLGAALLDGLGIGANIFFAASLCVIPVTAGIAILRHQLYDVDRLISRTLVYGALTVILGAAYVGLVLAGQALFSSFAGGSNLAIAASTLVVAALFLPLRSRVQKVVDRRFYRSRYDAQRTLEAFGGRLREQVELETLASELQAVVSETMQPAHIGLWRHAPESGR